MTGLIAMNDVREFIRAASPWAAMGLLVGMAVGLSIHTLVFSACFFQQYGTDSR